MKLNYFEFLGGAKSGAMPGSSCIRAFHEAD